MSLEAEVGSIGGEEDGVVGMGECADPKECKMVADLGIDFLAAGIGNIHGKYPANWKGLSFETLDAIQKLTGDMPLVLHGGTGIPADMIKKAIDLGVSKINVNTECQLAFAAATRKYIEEGKDEQGKGFDPRKLLAPGTEAIKATVKEKWNFSDPLTKPEKYTFYKVEKNKGISVSGHWFLFWHFHGKMFLWQKIRLLIKNKTEQRTMKL